MARSTARPIHAGRPGARVLCVAIPLFVIVCLPATEAAPDRFAAGKPLFDKFCGTCHDIGLGAANGEGPSLNGIIGRPAGTVAGYVYSAALARSAVVWTKPAFETFIADPRADMPGTRMAIPGVASKADRDAITAYVARFARDGTLRPAR